VHIEPLSDDHDVAAFTCGNKVLDTWLTRHAMENHRRDLSRVFVLVADTGVVAGYYSVTMASVTQRELPKKLGRGLPSEVVIGAPLLGRLAVATEWQGQGYGRDLLVAAVERIALAAESVAARFIAVDPIDEAAHRFYLRWGFKSIEGDPLNRMYLRLNDAIAAFGIDE
jgi:GNAT superfamily N-acetyltransferase